LSALDLNYFSGVTSKPDGAGELSDIEKRGITRLGEFKAKGSAYQEIQGVRWDVIFSTMHGTDLL